MNCLKGWPIKLSAGWKPRRARVAWQKIKRLTEAEPNAQRYNDLRANAITK